MKQGNQQKGPLPMEKIRAKKALGQNFLVDRNVLSRIVDQVEISPEEHVLEVGPGKGALTRLLAEQAAAVLAVELDFRLAELLQQEFSESDRVTVVQGDILRVDLNELLDERWDGPWKVAANLPYNISSQVLFRFLDHRERFSSLVLMLQKEVADRMVAPPDCRDYGILSVLFQLHYDIVRAFIVRPGSFQPVPKVDSAVIRLVPLPAPRVEVGDEQLFRQVVKAAFSMRRKTLWNCLKGAPFIPAADRLVEILEQIGIDGGRRGETLSIEEFAKLTRALVACR